EASPSEYSALMHVNGAIPFASYAVNFIPPNQRKITTRAHLSIARRENDPTLLSGWSFAASYLRTLSSYEIRGRPFCSFLSVSSWWEAPRSELPGSAPNCPALVRQRRDPRVLNARPLVRIY